jgi:Ca2+-binding RTX toxin-like protein
MNRFRKARRGVRAARAPRVDARVSAAAVEVLEERRMLSTNWSFVNGVLNITDDSTAAAETVNISVANNLATIQHNTAAGLVTENIGAPAAIAEINIDTGTSNTGADTIDLHDVTVANGFSTVLNGAISIRSGRSNDTVTGSDFTDEIRGGRDNDSLMGGPGNDTIEGAAGNDIEIGGAGADRYTFPDDNNGYGTDTLQETDAGGGDLLDFSGRAAAITVDLGLLANPGVFAGETINLNAIDRFENVYTSNSATAYVDTVNGNGLNNLIQGNAGNDVINGLGGNDTLIGGGGDDQLDGGAGNDSLDGSAGNDAILGGGDDDSISGGSFTDPISNGLLTSPATGQVLNEASGLVVGRANPGILWTIDDSAGNTELYANNLTGGTRGYYTLTGAGAVNYEDLAFWHDDGTNTNYIYIADIGDNASTRANVTIYRVVEPNVPAGSSGSQGGLAIQTIQLTYPNNVARDAEAFMVDRNGDLYIVSKSEPNDASAHLYFAAAPTPAQWASNPVTTLALTDQNAVAFPANTRNDSPSGADVSPNGLEVLIKSDNSIYRYVRASTDTPLATLLTAQPQEIINVEDSGNREAIAFDPSGINFYTVSENDNNGNARQVHRYDRSSGNDALSGQAGNDTLAGEDGNDNLDGGVDSDRFMFSGGNQGDDVVIDVAADAGTDQLDFTSWGNTVTVDLGLTTLQALTGGGSVRIQNANSVENLTGSYAYGDTLYGDDRNNVINGSGGNDWIEGRGGNDTVDGGDGNDACYGGTGNDYVYGGAGDDGLRGGFYDILSGDGDDTLQGGTGSDRYVSYGTNQGVDVVVEVEADAGTDTFDFFSYGAGVYFDLGSTLAQALAGGGSIRIQNVRSVENINGTWLYDDWFYGDDRANSINGYGGNDYIDARGGNDTVDGYTGNDVCYGGAGNDYVYGNAGDDGVHGGNYLGSGDGDDILVGGAGSDHFGFDGVNQGTDVIIEVEADAGSDSLDFINYGEGVTLDLGSTAAQTFTGGGSMRIQNVRSVENIWGTYSYEDWLYGDDRANVINGYGARDWIEARGGNDTIDGGDGNDACYGGTGNDYVYGNAGDDGVHGGFSNILSGDGNDTLVGGTGSDRSAFYGANQGDDLVIEIETDPGADSIDFYSYTGGAITFNLNLTTAQSLPGGGTVRIQNIRSVENLYGTNLFGDTLIGDDRANAIYGEGGNNSIDGRGGNDTLQGLDNSDTIYGGAGNDLIYGWGGADLIWGDGDNDVVHAGDGNDHAYGGAGNDYVYGEVGDDTVNGGDFGVSTGDGNDSLDGGTGSDRYEFYGANQGTDVVIDVETDPGTDELNFSNWNAAVTIDLNLTTAQTLGGGGTVRIQNIRSIENLVGSANYADLLYGDDRANFISGGGGNNYIDGRGGDDTLGADGGNDVMYGGSGNDAFYAFQGNDNMHGQLGNDTYYFIGGINFGSECIFEAVNEGTDTLEFTQFAGALNLNLGLTSLQTVNAAMLTLTLSSGSGIENVKAGINGFYKYADNITGNDLANVIEGNDGNDTLRGMGGDDTLLGGADNDLMYGGAANDYLDGGTGLDTVLGEDGNDTFEAQDGYVDLLDGGAGTDTVLHKDSNDTVLNM